MIKSILKCLHVIILLAVFAAEVQAQSRDVKGKVTDEIGTALPGVNILVKGTTIGTNTTGDGSFTISVPSQNQTLTFSSIGYKTVDVEVSSSRSTITVKLSPDVKSLGEVVVTALGVQRNTRNVG